MDPESMTPEELEAARRRAKIIRRTGFAFAFVAMVYLSGPMIYGAFSGVAAGQIWDPFTGEALQQGATPSDTCLTEAEELISESATLARVQPAWDDRVTAWTVRCRKEHPSVFQMIVETRRKLRARKKAPPEQ